MTAGSSCIGIYIGIEGGSGMECGEVEYVDNESLDDYLRVWHKEIVYGPVVSTFEQIIDYRGRTLLSASQWMVIVNKTL